MKFLDNISILYIYIAIINLVAFVMYGIDKWKAKHAKWRISEMALILVAILGGSIGALVGMAVWRHKTQHPKFKFGVPLILILQIVALVLTSCRAEQQVFNVATQPKESTREHSPNVFIIMYDQTVGKEAIMKAIEAYGAEIVYDYNIIAGMALKKPEDKTLEETMHFFGQVEGVVSVDYDYIYRLTDPVKPNLQIE
ncbi:MAG: DUF1294 domain-containing protein [Bacteroidales bacterium]|jgi:uncharacterized membrane protein YsdA (DUF1294 family)|nr:DUF1294 domain-containing protein [Bacteroidales bacterium]